VFKSVTKLSKLHFYCTDLCAFGNIGMVLSPISK